MIWFDPGYSFIHTAPSWGETGLEGCGVSINVLPPASQSEAPGSTLFPRGSPWTHEVTLGLPPGRWLTSSGPRAEVTQGASPDVGLGVCPGPLPMRTSDAGPCGHSASFSHGVVTSRADGSPDEGPCCLRCEGSGVVRASWRRVQSWRREGSQVGREGGAGPPPGRRVDVFRQPQAASCPWRRDTCPRGPAQRGARWGVAGARADSWRLRGMEAWGAWRRAPHLVRALPPALGGQVLRVTVCFRTGCLGVCQVLVVAVRVPWASGQKPLSLGVTDVCVHCTILRVCHPHLPFFPEVHVHQLL